MWLIPLGITLNVKKTRTGWLMTVRVIFIT
jgi:hypothetical protein